MPLFTYRGVDGPEGLKLRKTVRERHLAHLGSLARLGRVTFGGPLIDDEGNPCGSLVIFEADDLASAKHIASNDPYWIEGVFEKIEVQETKRVLP